MRKILYPLLFACLAVVLLEKYGEIGPDKRLSKNLNRNNSMPVSTLNLQTLFRRLQAADMNWKPFKVLSSNGTISYRYRPIKGEARLSEARIKDRMDNFSTIFEKEKSEISAIFKLLEEIGVSVYELQMNNDIEGMWVPIERAIYLSTSLGEKGSLNFHEVLAHEAIHVAQSCSTGSINSTPVRLGLPLKSSFSINKSLSHPAYVLNLQEGIYLEQEAYSYSKKIGFAAGLLKQFCK